MTYKLILDSERTDEIIDITIMCFVLSVHWTWKNNNKKNKNKGKRQFLRKSNVWKKNQFFFFVQLENE